MVEELYSCIAAKGVEWVDYYCRSEMAQIGRQACLKWECYAHWCTACCMRRALGVSGHRLESQHPTVVCPLCLGWEQRHTEDAATAHAATVYVVAKVPAICCTLASAFPVQEPQAVNSQTGIQ